MLNDSLLSKETTSSSDDGALNQVITYSKGKALQSLVIKQSPAFTNSPLTFVFTKEITRL